MPRQKSNNAAYRVTLEGRGCIVRTESAAHTKQVERLGFFTTRFVVAPTGEAATAIALTMVKEELRAVVVNPPNQPYELEVEEVYEDAAGEKLFGAGKGFTWFPDEE
jgi:hypothetical protein